MSFVRSNPVRNGSSDDQRRQGQPPDARTGFQPTLADLRQRAIRDASDLLEKHVGSRAVPWPDRHLSGPTAATRTGIASHACRSICNHARLWPLPPLGTVVELTGDETGCLGPAVVGELVNPLLDLAVDRQAGDLLVDIAQVRSLCDEFVNLLAAVRSRLKPMRRRLFLCGVGPDCGDSINGADLGIRFSPVRADVLREALARVQEGTETTIVPRRADIQTRNEEPPAHVTAQCDNAACETRPEVHLRAIPLIGQPGEDGLGTGAMEALA